jgi:hypothetical protein
MRKSITPLVVSVLLVSAVNLRANRSFNLGESQQAQEQNTAPEQQQSPQTSQPQASSSMAAQSETGCLVQTDSGYSLKTDTDTYPIETQQDLSQFVNKQIKVTGILEHHNAAAPSSANGSAVAITDLRLRVVVSVVGDCQPPSK